MPPRPPIRDFAEADMPALLDLWQAAWRATMPTIDFLARRPGYEQHLLGLMREGARLRVAADASGAPLGFVSIDPASGYLDQIAVRRDHWGAGVATFLIDDARALSPSLVELKVNQANHRAISFYEKMGFERGEAALNPVSGLPLWIYRWRPK